MARSSTRLITQLPDLQDRDPLAMEFNLSKIYALALIILINQLNCPRPQNAYNDAIIQEFIDNLKSERTPSTQVYPEPSGKPDRTPTLHHQTLGPKEPISILLIKLLLRSRIDLLRRILLVFEQDSNTLSRLAKEQERQIERMVKNYEDLFMRMRHMEKNLQLRSVQLIELQQQLDSTQFVSTDGTFVWNVDQVGKRRMEAIASKQMSIYSPEFFVHRYGYKMRLRMYLNGDGLGKATHMSLFVVVMKSPWDSMLRWPFKQKITLLLYDQNFRAHIIDAFKPDDSNPSFRRPENMMNIASGSSLFVPLCMLSAEENHENAYIKEDRLYVKVIIDCADLPSLDHSK